MTASHDAALADPVRKLRAWLDDPAAVAEAEAARAVPEHVLSRLAADGLLLPYLPREAGGAGLADLALGRLCEELGRSWMSLLSVLVAHGMSIAAIRRWASPELTSRLIGPAARGELLLSFALSEPGTGSDAAGVTTRARPVSGGYLLSGCKTWLSGGHRATTFLVFATTSDGPVALVVPRDADGVTVTMVPDLLGFHAAMLGHLELREVFVPDGHLVGRLGAGVSHVAATALDHGRYCLAWGGVGMAQASLDAVSRYVQQRRQFGVPIAEHQLVRRRVSRMIVDVESARLLAERAGQLREAREPIALIYSAMAKYRAAEVAVSAASSAVQLHGAYGCLDSGSVARQFRDAKLLEIIEGSTEIHEDTLAAHAIRFSTPEPGAGRWPRPAEGQPA